MRAFIFVALLVLNLSSCITGKFIHYTILTEPKYIMNPPPQKILLVNSYNVLPQNYRMKKQDLFIKLLDNTLYSMADEIQKRSGVKTNVIQGFTNLAPDSIEALIMMTEYVATHLIAITSYNVSFNQTRVDVTKTDSTVDREAFYDIVSEIGYRYYSSNGEQMETPIRLNRFHSSRKVISGFFAIGPDIVSNKKQALEITNENLLVYLKNFFPSKEKRNRFLYTTKVFSAVGAAIKVEDYYAALEESIHLSKNENYKIAAKAFYNCAVLSERNNQPIEAKKYLDKSKDLFKLFFIVPEAVEMMEDYR